MAVSVRAWPGSSYQFDCLPNQTPKLHQLDCLVHGIRLGFVLHIHDVSDDYDYDLNATEMSHNSNLLSALSPAHHQQTAIHWKADPVRVMMQKAIPDSFEDVGLNHKSSYRDR